MEQAQEKMLSKAMEGALARAEQLPEWGGRSRNRNELHSGAAVRCGDFPHSEGARSGIAR